MSKTTISVFQLFEIFPASGVGPPLSGKPSLGLMRSLSLP